MMIYKYPLKTVEHQRVAIQAAGRGVLAAGLDVLDGRICLWAEVDPDLPTIIYNVFIIGTGQTIPTDCHYVGTVFDRPYVWHVYIKEVKPNV